MEIHAAIDEYLGAKQNSVTHDTHAWYSYHLDYLVKWCHEKQIRLLSEITPTLIQQAVSAHPRINANTRHGFVQVVKGFLRWCSEDEELGVKEKTIKRIELPKLEQPDVVIYTDAEILRLLRACEKMRHPHRSKAAIHVLLDTGIRASELCVDSTRIEENTGLLMENLFIGRGEEAYIRVMGKGRKPRTIGIGSETRLHLQRYVQRERGHADLPYVFLAQGQTPWSVKMLQQFLQRLGKYAGVEDVHAHRFRHTFAINQLLAGTSDLVLMRLLGHTTLESTKIYLRALSEEQARKAAPSVVDRLKKHH